MEFILDALLKSKDFSSLYEAVENKMLPCEVTGLFGVQKSAAVYSLNKLTNTPILIIEPDENEARKLCDDLFAMSGEYTERAMIYPTRDYMFHEAEGASRDYELQRIKVLYALIRQKTAFIITNPAAINQLTIPVRVLNELSFEIESGKSIGNVGNIGSDIDGLITKLTQWGYERCDMVEGAGQYSRRGGIVDIFAPIYDNPIRIEFWDDEIDSMAFFDIESQRRGDNIDKAEITIASELIANEYVCEGLTERLTALREKVRSSRRSTAHTFAELIDSDIEKLQNGGIIAAHDRYMSLLFNEEATLHDYVNYHLKIYSETGRIKERLQNEEWHLHEDAKLMLEQGRMWGDLYRVSLSVSEFWEKAKKNAIYMDTFTPGTVVNDIKRLVNFNCKQSGVLTGNYETTAEEAADYKAIGYSVMLIASDSERAKKYTAAFMDIGIVAPVTEKPKEMPPHGSIIITTGMLTGSIELQKEKLLIISASPGGSAEIKRRRKGRSKVKGEKLSGFTDLSEGDYVVHVNHGVGRYMGMKRLEIDGIHKDYVTISYAGNDVLYVPANQLDMVSKYIGAAEDSKLKLNKMGSGDWVKAKAKVKSAVKDMADELIALYSARQKVKGYEFSPDNEWQREFEMSFEYDETDDQLRCIEEIKSDMSKPIPMDRLLCGDVGFGKTEVAVRAAFKCVQDSKQSALLVPTTILSWQHYKTLQARMQNYPIKIEVLNRFRTTKQKNDIIKRVKTGEIDILIGTHRIIQKDVEFKDLGLVIIDEEQRFGVAHKEKLKQFTTGVDVLTLTATPIPRTLNMAMSGVRDMSTLEEAPQDRHPVQTYVTEHNYELIGEWIRKEIRRGGQVFYLHNRVETIDSESARLETLVPNCRVGVAHGQMDEEALSDVWTAMVNGEVDVLVCTTIIETGVDLPNVNTLIIEDADRLGLAQLHQIRGRVGRSNRRAYAYFCYKRGKTLNEIAERRMLAIREFTEFGSGFKIAMRDLEIRGAGNILGGEQSGHMQSVGYDMYLKLLSEVVAEESGQKAVNNDCTVDMMVDAYIPDNYIEARELRIDIYKRVASIRGEEDMSDLLDELYDRFGDVPVSVVSLCEIALIRNMAGKAGIFEIGQISNDKGSALTLYMREPDKSLIPMMIGHFKGKLLFGAGVKPYFSMTIKDKKQIIPMCKEIVKIYCEFCANVLK